ncbi:winged helix-turn-helix domain-containing protein [Geodermatophilus sp. SYSU D00691]
MTLAPVTPLRRPVALPAVADPADRPVAVLVLTEDGRLLCSDPDRVVDIAAALHGLARRDETPTDPAVIRLGRLVVEPDAYTALVAGRRVPLTAREFELLRALARAAGRTLSRAQLMREVWPAAEGAAGRTVDVHVTRLRRKLGPAAAQLSTVRGVGYRLDPS